MAIEDDILVIGGGLAGIFAALAAAERARVRLVSNAQSTLRQASGLIDVLGYAPEGEGPIVDPFDAIETLPEGHPYGRVGVEGLREALLLFDAVVGDAYEGSHTDANALVPTTTGSVKPTARYPSTVAPGLASTPADTLLVGFETIPAFDAPLAASHLDAVGVPFDGRGVTIPFPGGLRPDATRTRYARALDRDEPARPPTKAGSPGVLPTRAALAAAIRPHLDGESRVGLPAILGLEHADVVRRDLEERLGVRVFEVPTGPPSLPGIRLERLLLDALAEADVRVTTGVPVVDYQRKVGRIDSVLVDRSGHSRGERSQSGRDGPGQLVPYRAAEYVLATGGLAGRGIDSSRDGVVEPIFDCHVTHPDDRDDWSAEAAFGDHPFARFGVAVDGALRPLDANGEPVFENLHAAGSVLGGFDFAAEKSGAGISIATGYAAGMASARAIVGEVVP